jgi:hypothetical protein
MRPFVSALVLSILAMLAPTAAHAAGAHYQPARHSHVITQHAEDVPDTDVSAPAEPPPRFDATQVSVGTVVGLFGTGIEVSVRYEFVEIGASMLTDGDAGFSAITGRLLLTPRSAASIYAFGRSYGSFFNTAGVGLDMRLASHVYVQIEGGVGAFELFDESELFPDFRLGLGARF